MYLDFGVIFLDLSQTLFRRKDSQQLDILLYLMYGFALCNDTLQFKMCAPGTPQSVIMVTAADAVPPVATSGSRRNTCSTGGLGGSFE